MWTLIIWSLLCTSADIDCDTGDYVRLTATFTAQKLCIEAGESWVLSYPSHNRYVCSLTVYADQYDL